MFCLKSNKIVHATSTAMGEMYTVAGKERFRDSTCGWGKKKLEEQDGERSGRQDIVTSTSAG